MRGQALAVFTLALATVIIAAALAFDGGALMLERRDQQNAADAAAIAGARFVPTSTTQARDAAFAVAAANGFTHGEGDESVTVNIPPTSGPNAGDSNYIEVRIGNDRPSIFAGIMGIANWPVSARAVAVNGAGGGGPFSILSLEPTACQSFQVEGNGNVNAHGDIQVNSTCTPNALRRGGLGDVSIVDGGACNVVGGISEGGPGDLDCVQNEGAPELPDPLAGLPEPPMPPLAAAPVRITGTRDIPNGCPGSSDPGTVDEPATCLFEAIMSGHVWRLSPGLYPGGLEFRGGTYLLEPGIYWIGGGGVRMNGLGTVTRSVPTGANSGTCWSQPEASRQCGGILFYNSELPSSPAEVVHLNGAQADIKLEPYEGPTYGGLVIFQDRTVDISGDDLIFNGGNTDSEVRGTVYAPLGRVLVEGNGGTFTLDQVIANQFRTSGNFGTLNALKNEDFIFGLDSAGLVE